MSLNNEFNGLRFLYLKECAKYSSQLLSEAESNVLRQNYKRPHMNL